MPLGFRLGPTGNNALLVAWGHNQVFLGKSVIGSRRYMLYTSIEEQELKDWVTIAITVIMAFPGEES